MRKPIFLITMLSALLLVTACDTSNNKVVETTEDSTEQVTVVTTESTEETTTSLELEEDQLYSTPMLKVKLLGLESYKELKSESGLIDQAGENEEYLIVYLSIDNLSEIGSYFNYEYLTSNLDDQMIETTYLLNNPKDYNSIFNRIPAQSIAQGYLVYKVPIGWKNLNVTYKGWELEGGEVFEFELTPDDLKEADPYVNTIIMP